jgi:hypothetical protein
LCIILALGGGFVFIGSFGACERDHITILQYLIQIIISTLSVGLALILFVIREDLKDRCYRRIESIKLIKERG